MAFIDDIASKLSGRTRAETNSVMTDATTRTYVGTATSASEDGSVYVELSQDVTLPDDDDGEHGLGVEMPTTVAVDEGDEVLVTVFGGGVMKAPVVTGNPGWGDNVQTQVDNAETLAQQAEAVATTTGQYFWHKSDDLGGENGAHVTQVPRETWEQSQTGPNSLWNSLGMLFRDGLNNLMALTTGATYTETFEIRADEDNYYILEHKPMVVESVTIDGTATNDYQWMNYDWNIVPTGGGTLALGYDTWYDNPGSTLSVTYRTSPAMTIYDGLGNLAANIQSYFTATEIGLGGNIYEDMAHKWYQHANVRFFGATDSLGSSVESTYAYDVGNDYISWNDSLNLAGRISDANALTVNGSASASGLETLRYIYDDSESSDDYRSESTSILFASSEGGTDPSDMATAQARLGVKTVTVGNTYERAFVCVDEMNVPTRQAIVGFIQPEATYTGSDTTATASANGWTISNMNNVQGESSVSNYFTFSNGVITALRDELLEISGVAYWNSGAVGKYGFGFFIGSSTVNSGTEKSVFSYKASASGQFSVAMPPRCVPVTAGTKIAVGRYSIKGSVYRNGTNFSFVTIRVVQDRSEGVSEIDYSDEAMG